MSEISITREMDTRWQESQPLWQQWWYEADLDIKMATSQQDYWNTFYNINYRNQKRLQFNKILRVLNMVGGYQRDHRLATIVTPRDAGAQQTADDFTKCLNWVMGEDNTYDKISQAFEGANMCGLNLLEVWMDYREDPESGDIKTERIPYSQFLMDNYWTKKDLSDCDWIWTRKYLSRKQLLSIFPRLKKDLPMLSKGYGVKDGKFMFMAQNWYQYQQELFSYDQYWKRDYRRVKKLMDTQTGEVVDWNGTDDQFEMLKARLNPNVRLISAMKPTVKLHVVVNGEEVYQERQPYGIDKYPFVPFVCYHYGNDVQNYAYRYQGMVRALRDSQIQLNTWRNNMMDIFSSQTQSGLMVKEDALVNPEDAFLQGPGKVLYFKKSANLASDVVPIQPPQIPQSLFELSQMLDNEIMAIAGINEANFGENRQGDDMSGFLQKLRMGAGLMSLQGVMDNLNQSQKALGDLTIDLMQKNFELGKISRILGHEPQPEFIDKFFHKYNCVVEEGSLTSTQKQLEFAQVVQLRQMGIAIPDSYIIDKLTIQGKNDLIKAMEQQAQQQQQMQQAQVQSELKNQAMLTRSLEARAQSDYAGAREKDTRALSNLGLESEREAKAEEDRARASLENVRAIKEMDTIDDDRLLKLGNFVLQMQAHQKQMSDRDEADNIEKEGALNRKVEDSENKTSPQNAQ
jgi:hypothetical protein